MFKNTISGLIMIVIMRRRCKIFFSACLFMPIFFLFSCASPDASLQTNSGYHNSYEGFVKDDNQSVEMVRKPFGTDTNQELAKYEKLLINPIQVWESDNEERFQNIKDEDLKAISDLFHERLVAAVFDFYPIVNEAGPNVLQIDVALTGIIASDPTLDSALIVVPLLPFVTKIEELITGNQSYVGATSIEGSFKDSLTGDEIVAFIDTKIGERIFEVSADDDLSDPYRYSKKAFEAWASRLRYVLDQTRKK